MNRITRCPSCTTVYQLEDAHLQIAQGWLRCGACGHVFDSTGLVLAWRPATAPSNALAAPHETGRPEEAVWSASEAVQRHDPLADPAPRIALEDLLKRPDPSPPAQLQPAQADLAAFEQALHSFKPGPVSIESMAKSQTASAAVSSWSWLAPYAVLTSALLLVVQLAYVQRDAIAAAWPESAPVIRHVCQSFGCQISPLRDAKGMVIDSSSLVQGSEDHHVLTWSVRNTTQHVLGMTALELSLLDEQGKLVLRTVVMPGQTGAPSTLSPDQSWSGSLRVWVSPDLSFSDHRLLSFYP